MPERSSMRGCVSAKGTDLQGGGFETETLIVLPDALDLLLLLVHLHALLLLKASLADFRLDPVALAGLLSFSRPFSSAWGLRAHCVHSSL